MKVSETRMDDRVIDEIVGLLERELLKRDIPIVTRLAEERQDAFEILISTLLSLRTKDEVTAAATERLFALASTPEGMLRLSKGRIQKAIYPVGFYRNKAASILHVRRDLIRRFNSLVP